MGSIREHDLGYYLKKYNLENYFETGTGEGDCLAHALQQPFKTFYTVDIDQDLVRQVQNKLQFCTKDVRLFAGKSTDTIRSLLPQINQMGPTLFFLDAHFPGADFHKCTYEESIRHFKKDAFPLEEEMALLLAHRDISRDVFIIDDFILYEEGDYETIKIGLTWKYGWLQDELGLQTNSTFLYQAFEKTHDLRKDLKSQGYLIATPKQQVV